MVDGRSRARSQATWPPASVVREIEVYQYVLPNQVAIFRGCFARVSGRPRGSPSLRRFVKYLIWRGTGGFIKWYCERFLKVTLITLLIFPNALREREWFYKAPVVIFYLTYTCHLVRIVSASINPVGLPSVTSAHYVDGLIVRYARDMLRPHIENSFSCSEPCPWAYIMNQPNKALLRVTGHSLISCGWNWVMCVSIGTAEPIRLTRPRHNRVRWSYKPVGWGPAPSTERRWEGNCLLLAFS